MTRRAVLILGVVAVVLVLAACAAVVWLLLPGPGVSVQTGPLPGGPGAAINVTGTRFPANKEIYVGLAAPNVPPTAGTSFVTAITDRDGRFNVTFPFPTEPNWTQLPEVVVYAGTPEGNAVATTRLQLSSIAWLLAAIPTTAPLPTATTLPAATATAIIVPSVTRGPIPTIIVQPTSGTLGSTVIVIGRGWRASDSVIVSLLGFGAQVNVGAANADADGSFAATFLFPTNWGVPTATVLARSLDGTLQTTAIFQVLLPTRTLGPTRTPSPTRPPVIILNWRGEYFDNPSVLGNPTVVRDDPDVDFNWGSGSPAPGVPNQLFSIRWTRTLDFAPGYYRFSADVDDGVRIWLDGRLVMNEWHDATGTQYDRDVYLGGGRHLVRIEYYQNIGPAHAHVWWQPIQPPTVTHTPSPTATSTPTATPTQTATPTKTSSPTATVTATTAVTTTATAP